jgi:hypothetical protein
MDFSVVHLQRIFEIIRLTSVHRLNRYLKSDSVRAEAPEYEENSARHLPYQSTILLWGPAARISLHVQFDLQTAQLLAEQSSANGARNLDKAGAEALAKDFISEFSNLHAGHLRSLFSRHQLNFGLSLPLVKLVASKLPPATAIDGVYSVRWNLVSGSNILRCSADVDTSQSYDLSSTAANFEQALVSERADVQSESGDIEFF